MRNGTGTYVLPAGNPVVTGTTITSTWANATMPDIGAEITNSIPRDGQAPPTANLPMGGYKHTGAANGVNPQDYACMGQIFASPDFTGQVTITQSAASPGLIINNTAPYPYCLNVQESGSTCGYWGADATYCFRVLSASGATATLTLDNTGNLTVPGNLTTAAELVFTGTPIITALANVIINNTAGGNGMLQFQKSGTVTGLIQSAATTPVILYNGSSVQLAYWDGSGNYVGTGIVRAGSDARWKTDLESIDVTDAISFVKSIAKMASTYLMHGKTESLGFVAQRVRRLKGFGKRLATKDIEGYWHLDYNGMMAPMSVALADALKRIDQLEKQIG